MLSHHELCFGCGRTNLFGLMLELEMQADGTASGRCFIKQDHQGADAGHAHEGVITAALTDAITLAAGPDAKVRRIAVEFHGQAPVGTFLDISATPTQATASSYGRLIAAVTAETTSG